MIRFSARIACSLLVSLLVAFSAEAANPMGIAFSRNMTNVSLYGRSTGMLITGRCNRYDAAFMTARQRGAEVLAYINAASRPDHYNCAMDEAFYMGNRGQVPLWPWPSYGQRLIWPSTRMTDMRPGSAWVLHVVRYIEGLMREGRVDGVFLDVTGARPWNALAEYSSWSTTEKNAWISGSVDLVRRLHASRERIRPDFLIINNNIWDIGNPLGLPGERYVDGVMLEHPRAGSAWHINYARKPFGNHGQRRFLVIARSRTDAQTWARVPGVTHVSDQQSYSYPTTPPIGFQTLTDR